MSEDERVQLGWRVSRETKRQFEEYVNRVRGETPGRKGRALEDAMREFMGSDRLETVERQLDDIADALGVEKKKGKRTVVADGRYHVPEGKNPGDRDARQRAVIDAILDAADGNRLPSDDHGPFVTKDIVREFITDVADVSSGQTVKGYLKEITAKSMFRSHPDRVGCWVVEP